MPRAVWKGHLKIAELACPVALHAAATTADRVSFRTIDRRSGNPVRRDYIDSETGEPVPRDEQVKGYETDRDRYVVLSDEDMARAAPESDKTLHVEGFLACADIDTTYFDRPYYLTPASKADDAAFALVREAMRAKHTAALARATLFRRVRTVLIRAQGPGLVADTLNFDYEVRSSSRVFRSIPERKVKGEMLDLARYIIKTKSGSFDPVTFEDRYDAALAELVRAKAEGRAIPRPERREAPVVVDLLEALRQAAGRTEERRTAPRRSGGRKSEAPRRKAG